MFDVCAEDVCNWSALFSNIKKNEFKREDGPYNKVLIINFLEIKFFF